ncbi:Hypothetical protein AKI40_1407 [Enterobacter sp. FY-07]|nr:Hypothetical protein AKI40_1407 [Enterobacter sp. FY-07]
MRTGRPLCPIAAQIAFMGGGFHPPLANGRYQDLQGAERARDNAGLTADALLLVDLHGIIDTTDRTVRATAGTGCSFTVAAGHRAALLLMFNYRNARMKMRRTDDMLLFIVSHYARHFAGTTSYTLLAIRHNKAIHGTLLFWFNKPCFLYEHCIYRGSFTLAMYNCPDRLSICHELVADQFISGFLNTNFIRWAFVLPFAARNIRNREQRLCQ